jgi:hypothetical protein
MKKKFIWSIAVLILVLSFAQCSSPIFVQGSVPPGQAKKQAGTQSAKEFAPGQQKKAAGEQSAKEFAPGQQKKSIPPGQAKKKN